MLRRAVVCFVVGWQGLALAQPCVTCRTERCPRKGGLAEWCGSGKDPTRPAGLPWLTVRLESAPAGATVRVGEATGQSLGVTPVRRARVRGGAQTFYFARDGYVSVEVPAMIARDGQVVTATLVVAGRLRVDANVAGAQVFLDGTSAGTTPLELAAVRPGSHVVEVQAPGLRPQRETVDVQPGAVSHVNVALTRPPPAPQSVPAPPAQAQCPMGQLVAADTSGRCCWPGQVWADERCVGVPTSCPKGFTVDGEHQRCAPPACDDGMVRAQDGVNCCWPGQAWAAARRECVGVPQCPDGFASRPDLPGGSERCLRLPTLARAADRDAVCHGKAAQVCDVGSFFLRGPGARDLTAEELEAARARYRQSRVEYCRTLAAGRRCEAGGEIDDTHLLYCCPGQR